MFRIAAEPIDTSALRRSLDDARAGAVAIFEGVVRDHNDGRHVHTLEYEAYEQMAQKEGDKVLAEARQRFGIIDCFCQHRVGALKVGETAVWVGVLAAHRGEAFDACRYIIDEIKHRLPIWKKEHYQDGDSGWVNCQSHSHPPEDAANGTGCEHGASEEWRLDILDLSGADLRQFEVIDVREPGESAPGGNHVWSLLRCEVRKMPASGIDRSHPQLDAGRKYLFVCQDGSKSNSLVADLRSRGHDNVFVLIGGADSLRRKILA